MKKKNIIISSLLFLMFCFLFIENNVVGAVDEIEISNIGVSIIENGTEINRGTSGDTINQVILSEMEEEGVKIGKKYREELSVKNSGSIDAYTRVIIVKKWEKTNLSPYTILIERETNNGWIIDETQSTPQKIILYYTKPISPEEVTPNFIESVMIDPNIASAVTTNRIEDTNGYKSIEMSYDYNNMDFTLEIEADVIQTHNAVDAIKEVWARDVSISADGTLSLL